jgi:hypothetical protein
MTHDEALPGVRQSVADDQPGEDVTHILLARQLKQRMALADFDNDGRVDLAIGDFATDRVIVFQGMADGSLRRWRSLPSGKGPRALVSADLNLDGILDLAVAHFFDGRVTIFHGQRDGQFTAARVIELRAGLSSMVGGDVDHDGRTDLAVANALSRKLAIVKNVGNGLFQVEEAAELLPEIGFLTRADIDGDNAPDLIAIDPAGTTVRRFDGDWAGALTSTPIDAATATAKVRVTSDDAHASTVLRSLRPIAGDGEAPIVGAASAVTFGVQLEGTDGSPIPGAAVQFLQLLNAQAGVAQAARATDDSGRATLELPINRSAGLCVLAASSDFGEVATLSALPVISATTLIDRIERAVGRSRLKSASKLLLQHAIARARGNLNAGLTASAINDLAAGTGIVLTGGTAEGGSDSAINEARTLTRVLVDQLLSLGAFAADESSDLACDIPVATSIAAPHEIDSHDFTVNDAERVQITVARLAPSGSNFTPSWRLLTGAGTPAAACGGFTTASQRDCGPLAAIGNPYRIEVMDHLRDDTGRYAVHIYHLRAGTACDTASVGCDAPVTGTIAPALDVDTKRVGAVTEGEYLQITVPKQAPSGSNFTPSWRLLTGAGMPAAACGGFTTASQRDCGPLSAIGNPYQIEVMDHLRDDTGSYAVHVYRLRAGTACDTASVGCDAPVTGTIVPALDVDTKRVGAVTEGEYLQITVPKQAPSGSNFTPSWRLLTGAGTPAAACGGFTTASQRDCGPLSATGNPYQIEVMDHLRDDTGSYAVHVYRLRAGTACDTATLSCVAPVTGAIDTALDSDIYRMANVANGDRVRLTLTKRTPSGASFTPSWRLLTGTGVPASSCGGFTTAPRRDCGPLPAAGNPYQIEVVDHLRDDTGAYTVAMSFLDRSCGSPPPSPADPRLVIDSPTEGIVGLNVTFRWHVENPELNTTYQFEVRLDKGTNACDAGIEEAINAQAATCVAVSLDPRRYSSQSAEFAIRAIDSRGRVMCQPGRRLFFDPELPPKPLCE